MRWSKEEVESVVNYIKLGMSYKQISNLINRTDLSIKNKASEIGITTSMYVNNEKDNINCLQCNQEILVDYKSRKFCSHSCSAKFNNKLNKRTTKVKNCLYCNNIIGRKNKYCNLACSKKHIKSIIFSKIEDGDLTLYEKQYKKYLIEKYGEKCMKCNWCEVHPLTGKVPIQMEHKDGNSYNNSLENLELLCPNCHSLTLTYGALNKGNGRKNRKR